MPSIASLADLLNADAPRLADQTHTVLRDQILNGSLPPGTRLIEQTLTAALGVSRTPLREALSRLEQEGLLERQRGGGLSVTELSREGVAELMGIRAVLEGYCARRAAEQITDDELAQIARAHADGWDAILEEDLARAVEANTRFHDGVNFASHAPRCITMIAEIRDWVLRYRSQVLSDINARRRSYEEHGRILAALEARDAELAEQLVRDHITVVGEHILAHIESKRARPGL